MSGKRKVVYGQMPNKEWTFVNKRTGETDTGILPAALGEQNDFAIWQKSSAVFRGGYWSSRHFYNQCHRRSRKGIGPTGLLGRMRFLLSRQKDDAVRGGHKSPMVEPERMVHLWESQKGFCVACLGHLDLLSSNFDHNHDTGEPRGFVHRWCNLAEGHINKMSEVEFSNFIQWSKTTRGN